MGDSRDCLLRSNSGGSGDFQSHQSYKMEKYLRSFYQKVIQIVIQSRLGVKKRTECSTTTNCWYNVEIEDDAHIYSAAKTLIEREFCMTSDPLMIEISLMTSEQEKLILELWTVSMKHEEKDSSVLASHKMYSQLTVLLKSLLSVTRATPAYKMSRKQGADSFIIMYRFFFDAVNKSVLGEGYKDVKIGALKTCLGGLHVEFSYRTKMTISPDRSMSQDSIMMKSDHFQADASPRIARVHPETPPLRKACESPKLFQTTAVGSNESPTPPNRTITNIKETHENDDIFTRRVKGGFVSSIELPPDFEDEISTPFEALFLHMESSQTSSNSEASKSECTKETEQSAAMMVAGPIKSPKPVFNLWGQEMHQSSDSGKSLFDEYLMIDGRAPFADNSKNSEVHQILQECCKIPQMLGSITEDKSGNVIEELKHYASLTPKLDSLVDSLCNSEENSEN